MSNHEFVYWAMYFKVLADKEAEAAKDANKKTGTASREFKRTMGNTQTPG